MQDDEAAGHHGKQRKRQEDPKPNWHDEGACNLIPNYDYIEEPYVEILLDEQLQAHDKCDLFQLPNKLWIRPRSSRTTEATEHMWTWLKRRVCIETKGRARLTEALEPSNTLRIRGSGGIALTTSGCTTSCCA